MVLLSRPCLCSLLLALPLAAQSASGATHFLVPSESGAGGRAQSLTYGLTGTLSSGVPAVRATSTGFVLLGGFPAEIETTLTGPWLTGVLPAYGPLLGGTPLTLYGTQLNQGPAQVAIGGVPATAGASTAGTLQTVLPPQPAPGYRPVTLQNGMGAAVLPKGIGVLPLIDLPVAHQWNVPFGLRYVGAQGDFFALGLSFSLGPTPLVVPPFRYALQMDLASLLVVGTFLVTDPGGELTIGLPAVAPVIPIYFQCVSFTQDPGWFPGSFTNVVRL
ncbi:MAG: IPT/TIG domain-containing protein [Planctomycetota bacterium]